MFGLLRHGSLDDSKDGEKMNRTCAGLSPEELGELWAAYQETETPAVRDRLIENYLYLVRYVAGKMAMSVPPSVEIDDLVSAGVVGLMDAVGKYDPGRDTKFETYAVARIRGAIVDDLRSLDWVPRSVRRKARMVEEAYSYLENELGRAAADEEVSRKLNMSVGEFRSVVDEIVSAGLLSLDDFVGSQDGERTTRIIDLVCAKDCGSPSTSLEVEEMREVLADAVMNLPDKERTVVALYYYEDMTLKEIGRTLGVSESRVSQIHTKAMLRLRGRLRAIQDSLLSVFSEKGSGDPDAPASVADEMIACELASTH
jgi:RNA polymerase sigma factor for flagellar operon FliA